MTKFKKVYILILLSAMSLLAERGYLVAQDIQSLRSPISEKTTERMNVKIEMDKMLQAHNTDEIIKICLKDLKEGNEDRFELVIALINRISDDSPTYYVTLKKGISKIYVDKFKQYSCDENNPEVMKIRNVILNLRSLAWDIISEIQSRGVNLSAKKKMDSVSSIQARHAVETGKTAIGYYVDTVRKVTGVILNAAELQALDRKIHRSDILVKVFRRPVPLERVKFPFCFYKDRNGSILIGIGENSYDKYRRLGFKPQILALEQRPDIGILLHYVRLKNTSL